MSEEELREKKIEELKEAYRQQSEAQKKELETERQVQLLLKRFLDEKALERLSNVKLVNKDLYMKAFQAIMGLAQKGYVNEKITEDQVKQILFKLKPDRDFKITRK